MSASIKLIQDSFPHINNDISEYVDSVLETSADEFETDEDVFEAIGEMLQENLWFDYYNSMQYALISKSILFMYSRKLEF